MCGIAGILSFDDRPILPERIAAMTDAMVHRGPDDAGLLVDGPVGLGMRRLSIIDLATGHQPIANEDGSVWVIQNGEIYNHRELRRDLERRGHRFATTSDTEVIVHLYEEHGERFVDHLRGMFGLAIWDARRGRLLLARDRVGIKPLYYARRGDALVFASELKAILALGEFPIEVDAGALDSLLTFLTTPSERSIVAGVRKLLPGHLLTATRQGTVAIREYWRLRFEPDRRLGEEEWIEALRAGLSESVRLHRLADVPLGAFLSGGIDSSAVVATMAAQSSEPVRTFSIGFREADYDELDAAREVATKFSTSHREAVLEPDVVEILDDLAWHLDEPFGDSSAIPTYMVSRLAAEEVKVALSGDGGDELFAGYDRYLVERSERRWTRLLPAPLRALLGAAGEALPPGARGREKLRHLALAGDARHLDAGTLFRADRKRRLYSPELAARVGDHDPYESARRSLACDDDHWLTRLQRLDFESYLPNDVLTKVDRVSMAHSLETRVPLLDHPFVELAARIPPELKLRGRETKSIFKRALAGVLPAGILARPKRGFGIPLGRWFRGSLASTVRELLMSPRALARGHFRPAAVAALLEEHGRGRPLDLELWTLVSFELWCRTFLDSGGRRSVPAPPRERVAAVRARA